MRILKSECVQESYASLLSRESKRKEEREGGEEGESEGERGRRGKGGKEEGDGEGEGEGEKHYLSAYLPGAHGHTNEHKASVRLGH